MKSKKREVSRYVDDVISGKEKRAGAEIVAACKRYKTDLERDDLEFRTKDPDTVIAIIEGTLVHMKGEDIKGEPLLGKPFLLEPFEKFIIYNLLGFWYKGTQERRFKEAFIELARKNGKTSFIASLAWAISILQRKSGSAVYIVGAALAQAMQSFDFLRFNLRYAGLEDKFRVLDNNMKHEISYQFEVAVE